MTALLTAFRLNYEPDRNVTYKILKLHTHCTRKLREESTADIKLFVSLCRSNTTFRQTHFYQYEYS